MKNKFWFPLLLVLALLSLTPALGQQPTPSPTPQKQGNPPDDEVVRVTTNLVQLDVVVLDKEGRQATNLQAGDFEVSEDGKRQQITNFSYILANPATSSRPDSAP